MSHHTNAPEDRVMKRTVLVVSMLVIASAAAAAVVLAAQADRHATMKVGTVTVARGQKASGTLDVPAGTDAATRIPVVVVHGSKPGPVLALVAGAHGTEYASIVALERMIDRLEPAQIAGTVIIVPLVNLASFEQKVAHVNPVDGKSMNRFYPGNMTGTQTERASAVMTKEVVEQCDHLIDLHGGDTDESLRPYSYWTVTGNAAQDRVSRNMALVFGLDHIIISADRPKDPNASRYLENTATTRGKPSLTAEAGHAGTVEPDDVSALVYGCENVMRYLKMMPGEAKPVEHPVWIERTLSVTSEVGGIFYPLVKRGTYAAEGMSVGYVTDYVGRRILDVRAPASGVVLFLQAVPSVVKGDSLLSIGVVGSDAKYLTLR
jgi:predicted deacylase